MGSTEGDIDIQCAEISSTDELLFRHALNRYSLPRRFPTVTRNLPPRLNPPSIPRYNHGAALPRRTNDNNISTRQALVVVGTIFFISALALIYIYMKFPEMEEAERQHVKIPRDLEDAKKLAKVLERYKDKYYFEVLSGIFVAYIFLQTFAIPGSISLSILSGFLFPAIVALPLICFCSATGATLCYVLSFFLGRRVVYKYFPNRVAQWAAVVNTQRGNLLNYIMFLRITPFLPNWFINIASPIIDVPIKPFWLGTFLGVGPPSIIAIKAGHTLYDLSTASDALSWYYVFSLAVLAFLIMVPVLFKDKLREKFE